MPIRDHPEAFSTIPCETVRYGVLVGVSTGYPPVAGRLHTRYAPVRRSPAVYCYTPLPLDLHVLGLPLAFILSQDQTLHCKNCLLLPLTRLRVSAPGLDRMPPTHAISSFPFVSMFLRFLSRAVPCGAFPCRKRVQRYDLFPNRQNFFSLFFILFHHNAVRQPFGTAIFFLFPRRRARNGPAKPRAAARFSRKSASRRPVFFQYLCNSLYIFRLMHSGVGPRLFFTLWHSALRDTPGRGGPPLPRSSRALPPPVVPQLFLICSSFVPFSLDKWCDNGGRSGRQGADLHPCGRDTKKGGILNSPFYIN